MHDEYDKGIMWMYDWFMHIEPENIRIRMVTFVINSDEPLAKEHLEYMIKELKKVSPRPESRWAFHPAVNQGWAWSVAKQKMIDLSQYGVSKVDWMLSNP